MTPSMDAEAFREFEHAGWEAVAHPYHHHFARLTTQATGPLLEAVGVGEGMRVLDVATGPGYAAAAASLRGADAVGLDFSAAQVALARSQYPTLEFHQGDAEALPFPDRSFDAVVSNFGMLHFARPSGVLCHDTRKCGETPNKPSSFDAPGSITGSGRLARLPRATMLHSSFGYRCFRYARQ